MTVSTALFCLALVVYKEARSEPEIAKQAVATVVLNRVKHKDFPKTVCEVVNEPGQFRYRSKAIKEHKAWEDALRVARDALGGRIRDPTRGSLYFHAIYVNPNWHYRFVMRIGKHKFYA